ncbi:MAG: phosphoenolpyruvate--protein phosphotransferase [Planctomycetota bacterium]
MSKEIKATPASQGITIAPVFHLRNWGDYVPTREVPERMVAHECKRLRAGIAQAAEALTTLRAKLSPELEEESGIYGAQRAVLLDPSFAVEAEELIRDERINAEVAVLRVVTRFEGIFESMDDVALRQRSSDMRDVGRQVLSALLQSEHATLRAKDGDYILAVDEFLPSDIGRINTEHVQGIIMGKGGRYSHGAILAKSLGIPCLVGLEDDLVKLQAGVVVILDGDGGKLVIDPEESELEVFRERMAERAEAERRVFEVRLSQSVTLDGTKILLSANIEGPRELESIESGMFDGIGLFRTEFAFMERLQFPSEEEQLALYKDVLERMEGKRVTFRVLDIGGDKPLAYLRTPQEHNPVLGWRGIRLTLHWRDLFYTQMRALVRASEFGPVSILIPMVTSLEEVRTTKEILNEIVADLKKDGTKVGEELRFGVMVEVPALGAILEQVLSEVDFLSVGSNDLMQYLLAVDRDNPRVSAMYDPCHPGVLRFLGETVRKATQADVPCSLCGEMAGESQLIPLLIGMGYRLLSMTPVFLPRVKLALRSVDIEQCEELHAKVAECGTADEVREAVRESAARSGKPRK